MSKEANEQILWEAIAREIAKKQGWGYPIVWNDSKIKDLQDDMARVLKKQAEENSKIYKLCKLGIKVSIFKGHSLTSSINRIFISQAIKTTREFTKNRFTFYLNNQTYEQFKKRISLVNPTPSPLPNLSNESDTLAYFHLQAQIEELVNIFEFRAKNIRINLHTYYHYTTVDFFLKKFEELHIQHIEALKQHKLIFANTLLNGIKDLSKELQALDDKINPQKSEFDPAPSFFYLKNKALGAIINIYISSRNGLDYHHINFLNSQAPNEEEIEKFYLRLQDPF